MKKICIVSSNRADYYLLENLIFKINENKNFKLNLLLTGALLREEFKKDLSDIEKNFSGKFEKINIDIKTNSPDDICHSSSKVIKKFSNYLKKKKIDFVILLGDRFELLGFAFCTLVHNIYLAHIHGGEKTTGSIDDVIRHSISKMSDIHFVSHKKYQKRLIQLGENKKNIFNVGAMAIENIDSKPKLTKKKIEEKYNINFDQSTILVTYHPDSYNFNQNKKNILIFLNSLKSLKEYNFIFTASNSDIHGDFFNRKIQNFVKSKKNCFYIRNFGQHYYDILKNVDCVLGNSSSGIIEVPSFSIPTIDVGNRQGGRERPLSVININLDKSKIKFSIKKALNYKFKKKIYNIKNPYMRSINFSASNFIINKLLKFDYKKNKIKSFVDCI